MDRKYFSSLLPPPNLTGILHLGHVWNATIQDFVVRWNKLNKKQTRWPLGLDHAGLSLQIRFEQDMKSKKINFSDWNKEQYDQEITDWKNQNTQVIRDQFKSMNFSIDYEDEVYTMDEFSQNYSLKIFKQLYEEGLIYQAEKIVNWDTYLKSAVSDSEVVYQEKITSLYYLKYFLEDEKDSYIEVATTRPETIFADVAIFVHPEDERYAKYKNKKVLIPIIDRAIPILEDSAIDIEFGTGAMKCTPGHDFLDWDLGKKHALAVKRAFDSEGILTSEAGELSGLHKDEAKQKLIDHFDIRIEEYKTNVCYSQRSNSIIEPQLSKQWFLNSSLLSQKFNKEMNEKVIDFYPSKFIDQTKLLFDNMHDWCISRQIKWGIRFPIYIHKNSKETMCSLIPPESKEYEQIEDRLDTWFTSSLWPLIVFNHERKNDFEKFFPIDLLVSGKDILLFWISKMLFMSWHISGKIPFKKIFLHGLILNKDGKKMSKSLNNGVSPEELNSKYGSDAIKLCLLSNTHFDENIKYMESKLDYPRRFLQKIKNAFSFFEQKGLLISDTTFSINSISWYEKDILNKFIDIKTTLLQCIEDYNFVVYCSKFTDFLWDDFCNLFLELVKIDSVNSDNSKKFISNMWEQILIFLYPIMPLFSEEKIRAIFKNDIYDHRPDLSIEKISSNNKSWFYKYIRLVRQIYHALNIPNQDEYDVSFIVPQEHIESFKVENSDVFPFLYLLKQKIKNVAPKRSKNKTIYFLITDPNSKINIFAEVFLTEELVDSYSEFVQKQILYFRDEMERSKNILSNKKFVENANPKIVQDEMDKKEKYSQALYFYENFKNII